MAKGKNMKTIIYEKNIKDEKIVELFRNACGEHKYFVSTQKEDFAWDHDLTLKEVRQFVLSLGETAVYDKEFDTLYHFYREI